VTSCPEQPFYQFIFKIPGYDPGPVVQEKFKKRKTGKKEKY
jgi:hypothetical protein